MNIDSLITILMVLVGLDIILTYFQFHIDKKFGCLDMRKELNLLPRLLINKNPTPLKSVLHSLMNIGIFTIFLYFINHYAPIEEFIPSITALIGMLVIINYYHIHNIFAYDKNWYNVQFWDLTRERNKVML